jgi:septum formation protein
MLVLASASPRRKEILQNAGIPFTVHAADIPEMPMDGETPKAYAERLAREKALAILKRYPGDFVLGADTIVVADNTILGKPCDSSDALRMLRLLSGRQHEVITGVCLVGGQESDLSPRFSVPSLVEVQSETTQVFLGNIEENEIREYVATGEPMDKAGAYAIQGRASRWISRIEGDYFNVVGLPVSLVYRMLQHHKII